MNKVCNKGFIGVVVLLGGWWGLVVLCIDFLLLVICVLFNYFILYVC